MKFSLKNSMEILGRTPGILKQFLGDLSDEWTTMNEGEGTWSPRDVLQHLIYCEKVDWMPRTRMILSNNARKDFEPFNQHGHLEESNFVDPMPVLLQEFQTLRDQNVAELRNMNISEDDLAKTGIHPSFGEITLREMLSTWTVHDLNHIAQITRVMSNQYRSNVGPWVKFLRILRW